jgi:hypothetical protein
MSPRSTSGFLKPFFAVLLRPHAPVRDWLLLTGKRPHVVAVLSGVVFLLILTVGISEGWTSDEKLFGQTGAVRTIFNTLLSGVILLISIVVSINSIVVSKELSELGDQAERVRESVEFRRRADERAEAASVSSSEPANYLYALVRAIDERATALRERVGVLAPDGGLGGGEAAFLRRLDEQSDLALDRLETAPSTPFDVFSAGLSYDHSRYLDEAYRYQRHYEGEEERWEAYEELLELLQILEAALQYFKTIYYQEEFADLSRDLLYTGLPAVLIISYVILWLGPKSFPGIVPGVEWVLGVEVHLISVFISGAFALALLPFVVLMAYILRVSAVTKRTLAAGPFVFGG